MPELLQRSRVLVLTFVDVLICLEALKGNVEDELTISGFLQALLKGGAEVKSLKAILEVLFHEVEEFRIPPDVLLAAEDHFDDFLVHLQEAASDFSEGLEGERTDLHAHGESGDDTAGALLKSRVEGLDFRVESAGVFIGTKIRHEMYSAAGSCCYGDFHWDGARGMGVNIC